MRKGVHGECKDNIIRAHCCISSNHTIINKHITIQLQYIDRIGYRIPTELAESIGKQQHTKNNAATQSAQQQTSSTNNTTKAKKKLKARPIQRSLTPHFDCCPEKYHDTTNKNKWRPIQCFVSLTENLQPNTGGFEAVPGFHREFSSWVENGRQQVSSSDNDAGEDFTSNNGKTHPKPCVGEYTHLSPSHDRDIMQRIRHIKVNAGSVVFWDNRIPHGNSYRNDPPTATTNQNVNYPNEVIVNDDKTSRFTSDNNILGTSGSRAVVYCSFLPDVDVNKVFVQRQLRDWVEQRPPRIGDRWIRQNESISEKDNNNSFPAIKDEIQFNIDEMQSTRDLTPLGKRLIGLVEWTKGKT